MTLDKEEFMTELKKEKKAKKKKEEEEAQERRLSQTTKTIIHLQNSPCTCEASLALTIEERETERPARFQRRHKHHHAEGEQQLQPECRQFLAPPPLQNTSLLATKGHATTSVEDHEADQITTAASLLVPPTLASNGDATGLNNNHENENRAGLSNGESPQNGRKPRRKSSASGVEDSMWVGIRTSGSFLALLFIAGAFLSYNQLVYVGITFSYGTLAGNRHLNFLLLILTGIPARIVAASISVRCQRRPSLFLSFFGVALCFLVLAASRVVLFCHRGVMDLDAVVPTLRKVLNVSAKSIESICKRLCVLAIQESLPTSLRGRAYLVAVFCGRVTAVAATYVSYFQKRAPLAVESLIGVLGVVVALSVWTLPETKGQPLPLDLAEMQKITCRWCGRGKKRGEEEEEEEEENGMEKEMMKMTNI